MGRSAVFDPSQGVRDLAGQVILVTGGNAGLGKETVAYLAAHSPARIYLAARTASKATNAIKEIKSQVPDASIEHLPLDLTSFASIAEAAATFKAKETRLDILINNAGIMATPYSATEEGYEIQFGTNHVGHTLLTKLLLPLLLKTAEDPHADVRIINVTSMAHYMAPSGGIVWDQVALEKHLTWRRYGQSKLANILFSHELAIRYPQITTVAVHPGVILTELYTPAGANNLFVGIGLWIYKFLVPYLPGHFVDAKGGALAQTWVAGVEKERLENGAFYVPVGRIHRGSAASRDPALAKKLWEWTDEQLGKHGY